MSTEQQTVASLKDEIVERGLYNDFKVLLAARNKQDLLDVFVRMDDAAKYAVDIGDCLVSFKKRACGYFIGSNSIGRRLFIVNDYGDKATGHELVLLFNLMKEYLNATFKKKDGPVKQNKQSFNRVVFFHDACETQHFELNEISLQAAIEAYCDEFFLEDDDIKDIQVLFFNESDLKRIEKKVTYKVLD